MVPLPVDDAAPSTRTIVENLGSSLSKSRITDRTAAISSGVDIAPATIQAIGPNSCIPPTGGTAHGLSDGFETFSYNLDRNASVSLNAYASGELSGSDRVTLYRFMLYRDIADGSGRVIGTCGAGVQLAVRIRNASASINTSLPFLAANAQLGLAQVEYRMKTFGLSGPGVTSAVPLAAQLGQFNADSYAALLRTLDRIQTNLSSTSAADSITVAPRLVELVNDAPRVNFDRQVAVQTLALGQIQRGSKCAEARTKVPNRDATTDALIDEVYRSVVGGKACDDNIQPTQDLRQQVTSLLKSMDIKID
ncbi:hypothetical protein ABIC78_002580 [Novosphingobium sp. 1529]|uniref:hypothetical protein n=1 Tax=Novosphingobium sp. 1529 TaxID=3156424 RepID=UPI0033997F23